MNPDRNMQVSLASLGEVTPVTSPVRRLFCVPTWKEELSNVFQVVGKISHTANGLK